jgi:hypothetical protein
MFLEARMITLKIIDSLAKIDKNVNKAIAEHLNRVITRNQTSVLTKCKNLAQNWLVSQPEIQSLISSSPDSLSGQFGIPAGSVRSVVNRIIVAVKNAITPKLVLFNDKLKGGLEINFQPKGFVNLLGLPEGHVIYQGGDLHWLDWLLKRGDNIIVVNYQYNPISGLGRSGLGIMVPGGSFRVPPQFSGTDDNNFITRALVGPDQEKQITQIFQNALK